MRTNCSFRLGFITQENEPFHMELDPGGTHAYNTHTYEIMRKKGGGGGGG